MTEEERDIEQETQHAKKAAATQESDVDGEGGIEQETQHEKKAAATKPSKDERSG